MLKIYIFSLIIYGSLFISVSKASERELAEECAKKAAGINYQTIKNIMDEYAGNDDIEKKDICEYRLSEDKKTASYYCGTGIVESFFINCNTKSPKVGILNTSPYINRTDDWEVDDCFKKAGLDIDKMKGTNCIKRTSYSAIQTFYICDEHISKVDKCNSSKPIVTDLMMDVKKYKGTFPHVREPVYKVDMNFAQRCAEAANVPLDFGPFPPETCRASLFDSSKFKINQTQHSTYVSSAPSSDKYDYNDFLKNKITNPGSIEAINSRSLGDSNAYILSSSGKNIDSSSSMIYDLYEYIKEKILSGKVERSRTVSVIINCMNSRQIIIPRCDKVKTFVSSKDVNSASVWDGSRSSKPSSGEESGNQGTKANSGVTR